MAAVSGANMGGSGEREKGVSTNFSMASSSVNFHDPGSRRKQPGTTKPSTFSQLFVIM